MPLLLRGMHDARLADDSQKGVRKHYEKLLYVLVTFLLTADGIYLSIGGMKVTPGRSLSVIIGLLLFLRVSYRGRVSYGGPAGLVLLSWMTLSLVVDILHAGTPLVLHHWINLATGVIWFYIVVNTRPDWRVLQQSVVRVGVIIGFLSVLALGARMLSINPWGLIDYWVPREVDLYRLVMFSWEPNIFGGIMALGLLMVLPFFDKSPRKHWFPVLLLSIALAGSLSKGPWLAFLAGFTAYVAIVRTRRMVNLYLGLLLMAGMAGVLLPLTHPGLLDSSIIRPENVYVRWVQAGYAFKDIVKSPVFGNGTFSFGDLWPYMNHQFGDMEVGSAWISGTVLGVLHDTGVVGLTLFLSFWLLLIRSVLMTIRRVKRDRLPKEFASFIAALISCQIALMAQGIATTLYALPVYWAVLGLVARAPQWYADYCSGEKLNALATR